MRFVAVHDVDEPLLEFRAVAGSQRRGWDLEVVAAEMDEGDWHYEILDFGRGVVSLLGGFGGLVGGSLGCGDCGD